MKRKNVKILWASYFVLIGVLCTGVTAYAADVTVAINRGARDDTFLDLGDDKVRTSLQANRSYSCIVLNREYDGAIPKAFPVFETTVTAPDMTTFTASALGTMKPGIAVPAGLLADQSKLRLSFIAPLSGTYSFTLSQASVMGSVVPSTTLRCNDTTLYGGYNRFFATHAIVELSNDTFTDIEAFITIVDSFGSVLVDKQSVVVTANNRNDVVFDSLPAGNFGQIIVTYVGSLGALSGYVSEYDFDGTTLTLKRERIMDTTPVLP